MYEKLGDKEKVITKGHYLNYLPQAMELLANEWFGRVYNEIPNAERDVLKVLAREFEGMKISEIAKKLRKPLGPVSALVRRLVDGGQVVKVERGHYRIFCMLYGKYVLQRN
jgi:predicted transcriptional regulator